MVMAQAFAHDRFGTHLWKPMEEENVDGVVEHIVLLLTDGRTVRLDPGVELPLGVAMDALTRAAAAVATQNEADDPMPS